MTVPSASGTSKLHCSGRLFTTIIFMVCYYRHLIPLRLTSSFAMLVGLLSDLTPGLGHVVVEPLQQCVLF